MNLILGLFSWIDFFIHTGVAEVFKLIFRIAEVDIFTEEAIGTFANRIYGILGVLILFKIVISCIQYLVSPDKMADKDKGMGALITRTIISFVLLALVPTIFSFAKKVETNIAGVIPTIILGQNVDYRTQDGETPVEKVGSWMSFVTLKAFVTEKEDKKTEIANKNLKMENFDDFKKNIMVGCGVFSLDGCVYDYNVVFSLLVGVFMLYILLSMGIDIAIRTIKLGILQILAPIPIASYINGQENFKTWYQTALKVYADLFIRLIVIYFIVYIMVTIGSGGMSIGFLTDPFVVIYIIVGLLFFAKQAPKFICDILGIKSDGFGDIGKMFTRPAKAAAIGAAGLATGLGAYKEAQGWFGKGKTARNAALRAAAAATARASYSAYKGGKVLDIFASSRDKALAKAKERFEFDNRNPGLSKKDRRQLKRHEMYESFIGVTTGAEQISREKGFYEAELSLKSNEKKNNLAKVNALSGFVDNKLTIAGASEIRLSNGHTYTNASEFFEEYNELAKLKSRSAAQQSRFIELSNDRVNVERISSRISLKNGNSYGSYGEFLSEFNGLQNIPYDKRTPEQEQRFLQLQSDKDLVEKFMIRNESFIALTNPSKDEGNYSAIAADVIKISRSGTPEQVNAFLRNIGGGKEGDEKIGSSILEKLTNHEALSHEEAISLNDYIAGDLESHAQKGISAATARERTIPKK